MQDDIIFVGGPRAGESYGMPTQPRAILVPQVPIRVFTLDNEPVTTQEIDAAHYERTRIQLFGKPIYIYLEQDLMFTDRRRDEELVHALLNPQAASIWWQEERHVSDLH